DTRGASVWAAPGVSGYRTAYGRSSAPRCGSTASRSSTTSPASTTNVLKVTRPPFTSPVTSPSGAPSTGQPDGLVATAQPEGPAVSLLVLIVVPSLDAPRGAPLFSRPLPTVCPAPAGHPDRLPKS